MIIGTNAYAPGLTVRWKRGIWESVLVSRLGKHHSVCEATRSPSYNAKPLYVVFDRTGHLCIRKTFTRRCDAKRAAEVLVGQWWREECEREALRRRYARALLAQGVPCFERLAMAARMTVASMNPLAAKGGDLDRLAEVYGVEARGK